MKVPFNWVKDISEECDFAKSLRPVCGESFNTGDSEIH